MNKFLDETNIVKKEVEIEAEDLELVPELQDVAMEESIEAESVEPVVEQKIIEKTDNEKILEYLEKIINILESKQEVTAAKTREDVVKEVLDRFNTQMITKEVEIALYHQMYDNANNTQERNRFQMTYENLEKEIKEIRKKIEIVSAM